MPEADLFYYARRAAQERAAAERTTEEAAKRHRELAALYDSLCRDTAASQNEAKVVGGRFTLENATALHAAFDELWPVDQAHPFTAS